MTQNERYLGSRDEPLPAKFTDEERAAYKWLWDCRIAPWLVDLVTKRVTTPNGEYESLVAFRRAIEKLWHSPGDREGGGA